MNIQEKSEGPVLDRRRGKQQDFILLPECFLKLCVASGDKALTLSQLQGIGRDWHPL